MSDKDRASKPLRLGRAFVAAAFLVVGIGAAVTLLPPQNRENWPVMASLDASVLSFFAFRWTPFASADV
jgi:hypothetical protein